MLLGLLNLLATVASYCCKPLLREMKLLWSGKDEVAHLHPQLCTEGKHRVLWAERWAAGYQRTPHSTACSLWRRCCSPQSKASLVQTPSMKCSSSSSSTYDIISSGSSAAGGEHTDARDGIHGQLGQGIAEVSHLGHGGLILGERSRIKALPGTTPHQKPQNQEHTCMPECLC